MCGIAGFLERDPSATASKVQLERMTALIAHRGPDDAGHFVRGNVALGHRRLSIIDLTEAGHQPMSNDDGSLWITYNGECYNYRDLARELKSQGVRLRSESDTEVLLRLYERHGEQFLERVDGMFAFALWDQRHRSLLLARDRLGIKPLYYCETRARLSFGSELKSLLADPNVRADINIEALSDYLHLLSIPDPHTIVSGISKLLPGHYLKVHADNVSLHRYWEATVAPDPSMTLDKAVTEFDERFGRSVASHMVADVPVGAFLSGGVDSSAIVARAAPSSAQPMRTFSVTFPGMAEFDESSYAAKVAKQYGTNHLEFELKPDLVSELPRIAWHADEPFAVSSAFAVYFLAGMARRHVKVVLTGDGADEVFAGYVWRHADFSRRSALYGNRALRTLARALARTSLKTRLPRAALARLTALTGVDDRYVRSMTCFGDEDLAPLMSSAYGNAILQAWQSNVTQRYMDSSNGVEQLARKLYTDVKTTLVSEMLTKADRMTMAHGLEARVPFLDHHLVDWAFRVPGKHKLAGREGKFLVKKAMERYLPRDVLYRSKHGFNVPLRHWLRHELKEFIRDVLAPSRIASRGLFRPKRVSALLDDHFAGRADASNRIFALLMLELWMQQFQDRRASFLHAP
jgi:asparagine synthase (glutamine-hydrolysing)